MLTAFAVNVTSAAILLPIILFLSLVMVRFPRSHYPPLMLLVSLSFLYLTLEALIQYTGFVGVPFRIAVQIHRLSEIVAASFVAPFLFLLERVFRLPPFLRKVTRLLMWSGIVFFAGIAIIAFVEPDLFVSVTRQAAQKINDFTPKPGRGAYGVMFDVRNLVMAIYAPYTFVVMAVAGTKRARVRSLWPLILGISVMIIMGLDDVIDAFTGRHFFLDAIVFGRFSFGITSFMIGATVSIMSRFASYSQEVHESTDSLRSNHERLYSLATTDELTGLGNRDVMIVALKEGGAGSIHIVDIDFFRTVNEAYGRQRADRALVATVDRLQEYCGESGEVYRIAPDRFAVLGRTWATEAELVEAGEQMVSRIRQPIAIDEISVYLTASVGAVGILEGDSSDTVMAHVEAALGDAKADRNNARVFTTAMQERGNRHDTVMNRLNGAIRRNDLRLHYQPIQDADGSVVALEALLRWQDDELGSVGPREFIPIAEDSGLIVPLTEFVMATTLGDLSSLPDGASGAVVNINVSHHHLQSDSFSQFLLAQLDQYAISPSLICLEITENSLVQNMSLVRPTLNELAECGVNILLDDFGAGYSALAHLGSLPIHGIKIDPQFIGNQSDQKSRSLVASMINMAHRMGLTVAAEGVEQESQLAFLRELGVDFYQGMHLGRPEEFIAARKSIDGDAS